MAKITLYNGGEKSMSKMLFILATIAALTGLASTAKAGETPPIMDSVTETQQHVLSNEEMSKVIGTFYYTIIRGDTLIGITEKFKGKGVTTAKQWQDIYNARDPRGRANSTIIGNNPNLIHPGQRIWIPEPPHVCQGVPGSPC